MEHLRRKSLREPNEHGYTLVEMAICVCIMGILMSGAMTGTSKFFEAQKIRQTKERIDLAMNVLSAYVQAHDRLPCPADPAAPPGLAGREAGSGSCLKPEGILPWKELAIPKSMVADGWGRPLLYRPAPNLTADMQAASPQDVSNACRGAGWYDTDGDHIDRAKALFCCNAWPEDKSAATVASATDDVQALAAIEPGAGGNLPGDDYLGGSFSMPHYMDGPAAPLLRSTAQAVSLSSPGDGGGPITLALRSDQIFARAGSGSCEAPASAVVRPYACVPQSFRNDNGAQTLKDPITGALVPIPSLYGVQLTLAGKKYQLRASLTKSGDSGHDDSLGFYVVRKDGRIGGVKILMKNTKDWAAGQTRDFAVSVDDDVLGIGLFVIPDGFGRLDGYRSIDLSVLKFVSNFAQFNEKTASVADQNPPVLVSVDAAGMETPLTGVNGIMAYHLYSNFNPGRVNRILRRDTMCHGVGEAVGVNHDIICQQPTSMENAGVNAAEPYLAWVGFEESPVVNCYETKHGGCVSAGQATPGQLYADNEGGYIASVGRNSYDDLAFNIGLAACPQGR